MRFFTCKLNEINSRSEGTIKTPVTRLLATFGYRKYVSLDFLAPTWEAILRGEYSVGDWVDAFDRDYSELSNEEFDRTFSVVYPNPKELSLAEINIILMHNSSHLRMLVKMMARMVNFYSGDRLKKLFEERARRIQNTVSPTYHRIVYKKGHYVTTDTWDMRRYETARIKYKHLKETFKTLLAGKADDSHDWATAFVDVQQYTGADLEHVFDGCREALEAKGLAKNLFLTRARTCGHIEHTDSVVHNLGSTTDEHVCRNCYEEYYVYVEDMAEYWNRDTEEVYYHESRDGYYSYAEDRDDDYDDDDEPGDPDRLMDYSTNVLDILAPDSTLISSVHGDFRMGIEFEMTSGSECTQDEAVTDVRQQLGTGYCVCKSDGSLPANGLEIVTAPRGLAEHIKRFNGWQIDTSYRAWDAGTCGMHIHIHSHAFSPLVLGKFVMFINCEENTDFIRKIAGRHPRKDRQAQSYCQVEGAEALENPAKAVKGKGNDRYYMINTQNLSKAERRRLKINENCYVNGKNYDTIELRIFRASLKKERLLAQIEFTHAAVMFCRVASWTKLDKMHFIEWLKSTDNAYPHLSNWYGIRRRIKKQQSLFEPTSHALENSCADTPESV